ncbi:MAG: SusD/RagB family nutrient-binding outer membrane lipoprotein, partial [Tannerellaceae bacterium]|nr:SusD/RagB family nutrient-binding outer membrane lipoprotein [Tannerellaceae bacterium]
GDVTRWIRFANNLKLRLLLRAAGTEIDAFVQSALGAFSPEGFLKEDAVINPGYNASSQQNPFYTDYHSSVTGAIASYARYYLPTTYLMTHYLGPKLKDDRRGALLYRNYPETPHYQLGKQDDGRPYTPQYVWLESVLKGREQGFAAFYAFEIYFLLAEAAATGHALDGDWKTNFLQGLTASFRYLESTLGGTLVADANPEADAQAYIEANADSYLANPDLAVTPAQQLEAIITQKYLASNPINAHEAWNDFRRTTYPTINNVGRQAELTFASYLSDSPREDKMPVRHVYPQAEYDLNEHTPDVGNAYSNPIFWDKN